jgi:hypothetical protein
LVCDDFVWFGCLLRRLLVFFFDFLGVLRMDLLILCLIVVAIMSVLLYVFASWKFRPNNSRKHLDQGYKSNRLKKRISVYFNVYRVLTFVVVISTLKIKISLFMICHRRCSGSSRHRWIAQSDPLAKEPTSRPTGTAQPRT